MRRAAMPRRERGQAMVEFAIVAALLVSLMLVLGLLARYLDIGHSAEMASRYVAFEGQVRNSSNGWKSDAELSAEVRRRYFSRSDAPIKTGDVAGDFKGHRNPYWTDAAGRPLIAAFEEDVKVSTAKEDKTAIAAAELFRDALDLSNDNLLKAEVTVKIANVPGLEPFDSLDLKTTRKTALLVDTWTARNPGQIKDRITGSMALYPLGPIKPLVDLVGMIPPTIYDPPLKLSEHDWDVVPCDRLVGGC